MGMGDEDPVRHAGVSAGELGKLKDLPRSVWGRLEQELLTLLLINHTKAHHLVAGRPQE